MKLVLQVRLVPSEADAARLRLTIARFNEAANWLAGVAFEHRLADKYKLHKVTYKDLRLRFGLAADMTLRCIARVCSAYVRDLDTRPVFRANASVPYAMGRNVRFLERGQISIGTLDGRATVPFLKGKYHDERFGWEKGQGALILREDGKWFLTFAVEAPEDHATPVINYLGVDLGIANLATDDWGTQYSGEAVERVRLKQNLQRQRLQKRDTKGAKKKLRRLSDKAARFRRHENHCISKAIVLSAKRTGCGIALEDLKGIRERVTARGGDARDRLSGWGFGQLGTFIAYKARLAGIPVVQVDPRNTSKMCSACGHVSRSNRKSQSEFVCGSCGFRMNADHNAARNIRVRALGARKSPIGLVAHTVG